LSKDRHKFLPRMRRPVVLILSRARNARHDRPIRHQALQRHRSDDNVTSNLARAHARKMIWPGQEVVIGFEVTYSMTQLGHDVFIQPQIERGFKFRHKTISPHFTLYKIVFSMNMTRVSACDGNSISPHTGQIRVEFTLNRNKKWISICDLALFRSPGSSRKVEEARTIAGTDDVTKLQRDVIEKSRLLSRFSLSLSLSLPLSLVTLLCCLVTCTLMSSSFKSQ